MPVKVIARVIILMMKSRIRYTNVWGGQGVMSF